MRPWLNDESEIQNEGFMKPNPNRLMWVRGLGAGFAALCCFTPIAVVALGAAGAGAAVAWLVSVVFPALFLFTAMFLAAWLWSRRRNAAGLSQDSISIGSEPS